MPELPDVETYKRYLNATSLHQEINEVEVRSPILVETDDQPQADGAAGEMSVQELEARLKGHSFASTCRYGKWLFVELDDGDWLVLHFGMSGSLAYFKDMEKDPPYDQFLITFANGYHLAYDAARKLGEIEVIQDPAVFIREKGLGPDVLAPDFDVETFLEILEDRRGMIKPALMDQELVAGIGNVYSDEILFQAGIHPRREVDELDEGQRSEIYEKMQQVLRTAIERQADPERLPDSYIIPHRHPEGQCPRCGGELKQVQVSGRTAYYCPKDQGSAS
jgi:formamidopyrimidine-DNA glycosylase